MRENYIRFDWAIKRLLRQKANFVVLEGFLSELLNDDITIDSLLESEANQEDENDKFNRVDLLARNHKGELIIVEVQNTRELAYFQRMLYATSKVISEYIYLGDEYNKVRKVYSINIVYFDLGQGNDYIYHGYTHFKGVHSNEELLLSKRQQSVFSHVQAGDLFPEYYVIRLDEFNQKAVTPIDEWIQYLKTGEIVERPQARGLSEALEILKTDRMTREEKARYIRHMENISIQADMFSTTWGEGMDEGIKKGREEGMKEGREEGMKEGREEGMKEGLEEGIKKGLEAGIRKGVLRIAANMKQTDVSPLVIADATGLSAEEIEQL